MAKFGSYTAIDALADGDLFLIKDISASPTQTKYATMAELGAYVITDNSGVVGPASSSDNAIVRFDLGTGKLVQSSSVLIDDSNNITGVVTLTATTLAGTLSTVAQNSVTTMTGLVTVGTIGTGVWQGTVVDPTYGGTGLTSIATLLNSNVTPTTLGLVIGTNVQAYNANLTAINQALTTTSSPTFVGLTLSGAVTGVTTLTATTLAGTLSTVTQNSVTTMTGLTTIGTGASATVGIGTASPNASYKLTVSGTNSGVLGGIALVDTGASGKSFSFFSTTGSLILRDITAAATRLSVSTAGAFDFQGNTVETGALTVTGAMSATTTITAPRVNGSTSLGYLELYGDAAATGWVRLLDTGHLSISGNTGGNRYIYLGAEVATYTGTLMLQAGGGSAGFGGGLSMYGHAHATKPGSIIAGISASSGGSFRVNGQGLGAGTDVLTVDAAGLMTGIGNWTTPGTLAAGATTITGAMSATTTITAPRVNGSTSLGYLLLYGDAAATSGITLYDTGAVTLSGNLTIDKGASVLTTVAIGNLSGPSSTANLDFYARFSSGSAAVGSFQYSGVADGTGRLVWRDRIALTYTDVMTITSGNLSMTGGGSISTTGTLASGTHTITGDITFASGGSGTTRNIGLNTSDAADNSGLISFGGGSASSTRGASIALYGNEEPSNTGSVYIKTGNAAGGHFYLLTQNTNRLVVNYSGAFDFQNNSLTTTGTLASGAITSSGNLSLAGNGTGSRWILLGAESDTYAGALRMQAGAGSAGYGGSISLYGHSHATYGGDVVVGVSLASGGSFRVNSTGIDTGSNWFEVTSTGAVIGATGTGTLASGALTVTGTGSFSDDIILTTTAKGIRSNTSDASDTKYIYIAGGGADSDARGGRIRLYGNEHATLAGKIDIGTGNVSGASIIFSTQAAANLTLSGASGSELATFVGQVTVGTYLQGTTTNGYLDLRGDSGASLGLRIDDLQNVVCNSAAIATTATDGFLYIPSCAGLPTGVPTTYTGRTPMVFDTTNNKLMIYDGGWIGVTLA